MRLLFNVSDPDNWPIGEETVQIHFCVKEDVLWIALFVLIFGLLLLYLIRYKKKKSTKQVE